MNIVFCINALEGGGAERVVLTLIDGLIKDGHGIDLILVYKDERYAIPKNINVHYLLAKKPTNIIGKIVSIFYASLKLRKIMDTILKEKEINLFTSHLPLSNYISWMANVKNHFAVIHSAYSKKYRSKFKRYIISKIHKGKKLISVSNGAKDDLVTYFNLNSNNIITIYNPFDIDTIKKQSIESIDYNLPYIIHIGRLTKLKRHDLLIESYAKSKLSEKYNLLLLGDGEEKENIKLLIDKLNLNDKVILLGWESNPFKWISNAKLLFLTSDYEGFGNTLVESLICNTPIVSVDCNYGPNEILTDKLTDFLVPVNNEKELIKTMDKAILIYPNITEEMYEKFSLETAIDKYIKLSGLNRGENK